MIIIREYWWSNQAVSSWFLLLLALATRGISHSASPLRDNQPQIFHCIDTSPLKSIEGSNLKAELFDIGFICDFRHFCPSRIAEKFLEAWEPPAFTSAPLGHKKMEPPSRFELETPSLPWKCSTTELRRQPVANSSTKTSFPSIRTTKSSL